MWEYNVIIISLSGWLIQSKEKQSSQAGWILKEESKIIRE